MTDTPDDPARRTMTLAEHLPASRAQVWKAMSDPDLLPGWFVPEGYRLVTKQIDLRHGGHWIFDMIGPGGMPWPNRHRYIQWHPEERIDYLMDNGTGLVPPAEVFVTFEAEGAGTRVTQTVVFPSEEFRIMAESMDAVNIGMKALHRLGQLAKTL